MFKVGDKLRSSLTGEVRQVCLIMDHEILTGGSTGWDPCDEASQVKEALGNLRGYWVKLDCRGWLEGYRFGILRKFTPYKINLKPRKA